MGKTSPGTRRMIAVAMGLGVAVLLAGFAVRYNVAHAGDKAPAVGTAAPDFTLHSQENKPVSLHDYKSKMGGALFLPQGFHQRLHGGSA